MKKSLLIIALTLVLISVTLGRVLSPSPKRLVFAANPPLEVTWDDPLFTSYDNLLPGDAITTKEVTVKNTSATGIFDLYFGAVDTDFTEGAGGGLLHDELEVALTDVGGVTTYWEGTLAALFQIAEDGGCADVESIDENCAVDLGIELQPDDETTIEMSVGFDQSVGNAYQNAEVIFDLLTGFLAAGTVLGAATGPDGLLGLATGTNLIYSVLGSLAAFSTGLYLRRRSSSEEFKTG